MPQSSKRQPHLTALRPLIVYRPLMPRGHSVVIASWPCPWPVAAWPRYASAIPRRRQLLACYRNQDDARENVVKPALEYQLAITQPNANRQAGSQ
jgi:hypothetical protein